MKRVLMIFSSVTAFSIGAVALTPAQVVAQCQWGCTCMGNACGCNSNGSGSRCDTGGDGCVVTQCTIEMTLHFAPDGSPVQRPGAASVRDMPLAAREGVRLEFVSSGWSVERHCSGLVMSRRITPAVAAGLRKQAQHLSI